MKQIKFEDFEIIPILESATKELISDEIYFSSKYKNYISNSRLGLINPTQDGSPTKYKTQPKESSSSLTLGSFVHQLVLQPEEFVLGPKCNKPSAKLGATLDRIKYYRKQGESIYDSIVKASKDCDYYVKSIDSKIRFIIESGFKYYWETRNIADNVLLMTNYEHEHVTGCLESIEKYRKIGKLLHPVDVFGDNLPSFNEDALFIDVLVTYNGKCVKLPIKMKADNWSIDKDSKVLTLNDLKTTSGFVKGFMEETGSMFHYHYYRQFALYRWILEHYCINEFGYNKDWTFKGNVIVVNTKDYFVEVFPISESLMEKGKKEYEELLKRVAFYEMFGYDKEVEFI